MVEDVVRPCCGKFGKGEEMPMMMIVLVGVLVLVDYYNLIKRYLLRREKQKDSQIQARRLVSFL